MSGSQDIREWAAANGIELAAKGRIPNMVREQYEADLNGSSAGDEEPLLIVPDDGPESAVEAPAVPAEVPAPAAERAPVKPPRERRGLLQPKPRDGKPKPARARPRVSVSDIGGMLYSAAGYACSRNPRLIPTARSMDIMAPVAGEVFDDAVRGTFIDNLLQPLARSSERGKKIGALVAFPGLVTVCTQRPEMYPVLQPVMKMALMLSIEVSEPAMKKAEKRATEFAEKFGQIDLDGILAAIFADVDVPVQHSADEEAAVKRARGDG